MDYADPCRFSDARKARRGSVRWSLSASAEQSPTRSRELVRFQEAWPTGPARRARDADAVLHDTDTGSGRIPGIPGRSQRLEA